MVAIKDMKMPKYCNDCDFVIDSFGYCNRAEKHIPNYEFYSDTNERPDFCPLVEIEEPKVGKWIYKKLGVRTFGIVCSNCSRVYYEGQNVGSLEEFKKDIERIMRERNVTLDEYCCHCGAEMVGTENE